MSDIGNVFYSLSNYAILVHIQGRANLKVSFGLDKINYLGGQWKSLLRLIAPFDHVLTRKE